MDILFSAWKFEILQRNEKTYCIEYSCIVWKAIMKIPRYWFSLLGGFYAWFNINSGSKNTDNNKDFANQFYNYLSRKISISVISGSRKDLYQVLLGVYLCQRWLVEFKGIMQPVLFTIFCSDFVTPQKRTMFEVGWSFTLKMIV